MLGWLLERTEKILWDSGLESKGRPLQIAVRALRFPYAVVRDVVTGQGQLSLRAMSLVYTTLLSIVPLLAFSFAVLKGMNIHETLVRPSLEGFLEPLGAERATQITTQVTDFVDNVQGTLLGSVGLLLLLWTVISMVQKVEDSFNHIWQVERPRSFGRRFSEYLSVILVGPLLIGSALGMIATFRSLSLVQKIESIEPFGTGIKYAIDFAPQILVVIAFTFVYAFVPNTKVKLRAALVGGLAGGILWTTLGELFAQFVSYGSNTRLIYAGFAIGIFALVWLHISWLILLLGAEISFYFQHPEYLRPGRAPVEPTSALRERLALMVMYLVGKDFQVPDQHWTTNSLASHLNVPGSTLSPVIQRLEKNRFLVATENERLMPGLDMDRIKLADIVATVRNEGAKTRSTAHTPNRVEAITDGIDSAIQGTLGNRTLKDLVDGDAESIALRVKSA